MLIPLCVHANSVVCPCKWVKKTKKLQKCRAAIVIYFKAKSLNLRPMSFLNFSLRKLIAISWLYFLPLLIGVINHLKWNENWHRHAHTGGHHDLKTELAQWADSVENLYPSNAEIFTILGLAGAVLQTPLLIKERRTKNHWICDHDHTRQGVALKKMTWQGKARGHIDRYIHGHHDYITNSAQRGHVHERAFL